MAVSVQITLIICLTVAILCVCGTFGKKEVISYAERKMEGY